MTSVENYMDDHVQEDEVTDDVVEKRESLVILASLGKSKDYLGVLK